MKENMTEGLEAVPNRRNSQGKNPGVGASLLCRGKASK